MECQIDLTELDRSVSAIIEACTKDNITVGDTTMNRFSIPCRCLGWTKLYIEF